MTSPLPWRFFGLLSLCSALVHCAHVRPDQREALSKPSMDAKSESREATFQAHLREAREGSTASAGAAGGGCGCN